MAFYRDFLGFDHQYELKDGEGNLIVQFMKVNDRQCIELFPEKDPNADRLYQMAFIVEDIEALRLYLKGKGVAVPEKAGTARIGNLCFTIKDPDGHILEFVQYTPQGMTLQDFGKHLNPRRAAKRIKHFGFTVRSLEPSLAFYRDILGCTVTWMGSSDGKNLSWVNMKLPGSDEYLELMLYYSELSRETKGVLDHISLDVESMAEPMEELKKRAEAGMYDRPIESKTGKNLKRQLNLYDPDGTRAELMEPLTVDHTVPAWFKG
jgi:lactoylglutathione lyase